MRCGSQCNRASLWWCPSAFHSSPEPTVRRVVADQLRDGIPCLSSNLAVFLCQLLSLFFAVSFPSQYFLLKLVRTVRATSLQKCYAWGKLGGKESHWSGVNSSFTTNATNENEPFLARLSNLPLYSLFQQFWGFGRQQCERDHPALLHCCRRCDLGLCPVGTGPHSRPIHPRSLGREDAVE